MKRFIEKKYLIRLHLVSLIAVSLTFYFAYHLMQGERSYPRYMALQSQVSQLDAKLSSVSDKAVLLEARVKKMRPGQVDHDLLIEQARAILGYRFSGEVDYILR
jgi:cell division protein FtsB